MSSEARRCAGCGAELPRLEARYCEHCGAPVGSTPAPVAPPSTPAPDPFGDVPARFRALLEHPDLPARLAAKPEVPELAGRTLPSLLLLGFLALLGFFASLLCFQVCPPLGFLPLVGVVVGVLVLARQLISSARTPLVARAALVIELRARLQAGAERSPTHTRHFATLAFDDGRRSELECHPSVVPMLEAGRMGVVYLKGDRLAAFAPLAV